MFCISAPNNNEVRCKIGGVETHGVIDSGSKYNLMDQVTWETLKAGKIVVEDQRKYTDKTFKAYGGHTLEIVGVFMAVIEIGPRTENVEFYVIKGTGKLLIGRDTAERLGILKISCTVGKVDSTEEQLGPMSKIKDVMVEIPIKSDAKPVAQPYRRVPVPLEAAIDKKIEELLAQEIIEEVNGPSEWISPVVPVPKGDGVRICIDMRRANEAVERENHPLPTMEDFLPHIGKGKFYSKLDVKNAFHQVEISEDSRAITTFITRRDLFRYRRLMFGISCAPELFQKIMERILCGCKGCLNFIDDIIVYGATKAEHNERLEIVLQVLKENNILLNQDKCVFGVSELQFLGHNLSADGIRPTEEKLASIKAFREPRTAEEVRSFLGLVNYIGKFLPDLATCTDPLRQLT